MPAELNELGEPLRADASDLWGCDRQPGPVLGCAACGTVAERFRARRCWLCVASAAPHADPATGAPLEPRTPTKKEGGQCLS